MKVLFLTNLLPYPLDNGGKIKSYTTLEALKEQNYDVDLVCFTEETEQNIEMQMQIGQICSSVHQIYNLLTTNENMQYMVKKAFFSLFSVKSFGLYKYLNTEMKAYITNLVKNHKYDYIYFDHLQMYVYEDIIKKYQPDATIVLDEHNCEYMIMKRRYDTSKNFIKKIFMLIEYKKLMRFERCALEKADKIFMLSNEDKSVLEKLCSKKIESSIIPIGVPDYVVKNLEDINCDTNINLLYVGTLTWGPNIEGLVWFLKKVIPLLNESKLQYTMYIVGKNPSEEIKSYASENIIITGYVDDVNPYFEMCDLLIVPLFVGSGQRVKILEAMSRGFPVISTSIGAEGINLKNDESILLADNENQFLNAIQKLYNKDFYKKIAMNSRKVYELNYSIDFIKKKIVTCLKK